MTNLAKIRDCLKAAEQIEAELKAMSEFTRAGGRLRMSVTVDGDPEVEQLINDALAASDGFGFTQILRHAAGHLHERNRQALMALSEAQSVVPAAAGKAGAA